MQKRYVGLFALLVSAAFACSDPVSPRTIKGVYVLTSISGAPLPVSLGETNIIGFPETHSLIADTLVLEEDGTGLRGGSGRERALLRNGSLEVSVIHLEAEPIVYSILRGTVVMRTNPGPCDDCMLLIRHYTGQMTDIGIDVIEGGGSQVYSFRRVQ